MEAGEEEVGEADHGMPRILFDMLESLNCSWDSREAVTDFEDI